MNWITLTFQACQSSLVGTFFTDIQHNNGGRILRHKLLSQLQKAVILIQGTGSSRFCSTKSGNLVKIFCICLFSASVYLIYGRSENWPKKWWFPLRHKNVMNSRYSWCRNKLAGCVGKTKRSCGMVAYGYDVHKRSISITDSAGISFQISQLIKGRLKWTLRWT